MLATHYSRFVFSRFAVIGLVSLGIGCANIKHLRTTPSSADNLTILPYRPRIVAQDEVRAAVMLEGTCVSANMSITTDKSALTINLQTGTPLVYTVHLDARLWCGQLRESASATLGTEITPQQGTQLAADQVVAKVVAFVHEARDASDPMPTGKEILARSAADLLMQVKQGIRKAFGLMDTKAGATIHAYNRLAIKDIETFERGALNLRALADELQEDVYRLDLFVPPPRTPSR